MKQQKKTAPYSIIEKNLQTFQLFKGVLREKKTKPDIHPAFLLSKYSILMNFQANYRCTILQII